MYFVRHKHVQLHLLLNVIVLQHISSTLYEWILHLINFTNAGCQFRVYCVKQGRIKIQKI